MRVKIGIVAYLLWGAFVIGLAAMFPAVPVQAQATNGLRVIRVPAAAEPPSSYYGIDYAGLSRYTVSSTGLLTIFDASGGRLAVWAPGQWSRIERVDE